MSKSRTIPRWLRDLAAHRYFPAPRFRDLLGEPGEMFRFFRGDPGRTAPVMDLGLFPWWTDPDLKAEFCQALTVLTHRLDYALWPDSAVLMHAHSLAWFGALVALTGCLYRRVMGPTWVAALATLVFAVDDAHGTPAGWIANRNSLVAASFGVSALIAHDWWRRAGWCAAAALAASLLAASFFAKEEGIGTCAYLAAYGLVLDPAGPVRGVRALAPYAVVVLAWRTLRASWGYGVADMGLYVDPLTDPGPFWLAVAERGPALLLAQFALPPSDIGVLLPPAARTALWWAAIIFLAAAASLAAPLLRTDRTARFWALGSLLAIVPVCATFPMDRLLTFPGVGAAAVVAQFLAFVFGRGEGAPRDGWWRRPAVGLGWFLIAVHLILAPAVLPFRAAHPTGPGRIGEALRVRSPLPADVSQRTVVIVNAPSPIHACYLPVERELAGLPVPGHTRVLAPGWPAVRVRRPDARTLVVRPERGYLDWAPDKLFRGERRPFRLGQRVDLTGVTVEVTALTADGRPAEAAFRFAPPLEDPTLVWLSFRDGEFAPFSPPGVGEELELLAGRLLPRSE
jgi:hypothetical protein